MTEPVSVIVLIINDEHLREAIQLALESHELCVSSLTDLRPGHRPLTIPPNTSLILLDMERDESAQQILREVRTIYAGKILCLVSDPLAAECFLSAGCNDVLFKPFTIDDLLNSLIRH